MARTLKSFPSPQSQLRTYQRNQVPSVFANDKRTFRAFTVGTSNPSFEHPQIAMVALGALLEHSEVDGQWMSVIHKGPGLKQKIFDILHPHLGPKPIVFGVAGWDTTTLMLVFSDLSVVLTKRTKTGLLIYPAVMYLRTRDYHWTSRVMLGRGKNAEAKLRISYIPHGADHPKSRDDREHHLFDSDTLMCSVRTPPKLQNMSNAWHHWGQLLRKDVDHFASAFEQLQGHALWPAAPVPNLSSDNLKRPSDWPTALPQKPIFQVDINEKTAALQNLADWLLAIQATSNTPSKNVLVRQKQHHQGLLDVVFLPPGQELLQFGYGTQRPSRFLCLHLNEPIMGTILPDNLLEPLQKVCKEYAGLKYRYDGSQLWGGEWELTAGHAKGTLSAHESLHIFQKTQAPDSKQMQFWHQKLEQFSH